MSFYIVWEWIHIQIGEDRRVKGLKVFHILRDIRYLNATEEGPEDRVNVIIVYNLGFTLGRLIRMDYGYLFSNTPGNRKNIKEVGDDIQMVSQVTYLFIHVKRLAEQIDYVPVLALVLKITLYMLREGLEIAVIPNKPYLVHQDKGIGRELGFAEICYIKQATAWDFPVRVYLPPTLTVTEGKLCHKGGLARALFTKNHVELIRVAVLPGHPEKKAEDGQETIN